MSFFLTGQGVEVESKVPAIGNVAQGPEHRGDH
jgi:hypothetical protein